MNIEKIKEMIEKCGYECIGIRADNKVYSIGEIAENSHQLYQDPQYDGYGNLMYDMVENGVYQGFYDAGELDGTCAVKVTMTGECSDKAIEKALEQVRSYDGKHIYIIAGNRAEDGNDLDEIIIEEAEIIGVIRD